MSVAREVTVDYDLQALAEAAKKAGFIVQRNATARGWAGQVLQTNCDLVLTNPKNAYGLDLGFKKMADGTTKLFADNHADGAQNELAQQVLPRYIERMLENERQRGGRFHVTNTQQVGKTVVLTVGRG